MHYPQLQAASQRSFGVHQRAEHSEWGWDRFDKHSVSSSKLYATKKTPRNEKLSHAHRFLPVTFLRPNDLCERSTHYHKQRWTRCYSFVEFVLVSFYSCCSGLIAVVLVFAAEPTSPTSTTVPVTFSLQKQKNGVQQASFLNPPFYSSSATRRK